MDTKRHSNSWLYLRSILIVYLLILPAAFIQFFYVYGAFTPKYLGIPLAVGLLTGLLLGRVLLLQRDLKDQGEQFRAIVDLAHEFTYYRRLDGQYEYVSPSCLPLLGYSPEEFYAKANFMDELVHPEDLDKWLQHKREMEGDVDWANFDVRLQARDEEMVWVNHVCASVHDEKGRKIGVRSTNLDITETKRDAERIERMAFYDSLTDLPNRYLIERRIGELIEEGPFAFLFLDLNRFKNINDSFGHSFGDRLLKLIAERLEKACGERCMVGRFGGDEFVVMLPGIEKVELVSAIARRLLQSIEQPLQLDESEFFLSASIGVAFYPVDGRDADTLIRNADVAMYKGKQEPGGRLGFYSVHLSDEATHFVTTENLIYRGLESNEFEVFYQPKVDMLSGRIIGLEALARWRSAEGMIPPGDFIPVAEETGQIVALSQQINGQVLSDLRRWQAEGLALPVAVNVSPRLFADHNYCNKVYEQVEAAGVSRELFGLEITEQVFLGDIGAAVDRLHILRDMGFSVALDDFGTGYSSFNYLKRLPIDTLKIDRGFIHDLEEDQGSHAIMRAIASICRDLDLDSVIEGVETEAQRDLLIGLGFEVAQGFLFHRPQECAVIEGLLREQRGLLAQQ